MFSSTESLHLVLKKKNLTISKHIFINSILCLVSTNNYLNKSSFFNNFKHYISPCVYVCTEHG